MLPVWSASGLNPASLPDRVTEENMAKSNYSAGKRQRERDKQRKKQDKAARKEDRQSGAASIPVATVEELQGAGMMSVEEVMANVRAQHSGEPLESRSHTVPSRLFVGGLNWRLTVDELRNTFERFGPVSDVVIVEDRDTGDSRGFGFVTMADRKDAVEATKRLDGTELEGRTLVVRPATERGR